MKVTNIILKEANRYIHDSVYKPSATQELRSLLGDPRNDLFKSVTIKNNPHLRERAAQIVYIGERSRALMASVVKVLDGDDERYADTYRQIIKTVDVNVNRYSELTREQRMECRSSIEFDRGRVSPKLPGAIFAFERMGGVLDEAAFSAAFFLHTSKHRPHCCGVKLGSQGQFGSLQGPTGM